MQAHIVKLRMCARFSRVTSANLLQLTPPSSIFIERGYRTSAAIGCFDHVFGPAGVVVEGTAFGHPRKTGYRTRSRQVIASGRGALVTGEANLPPASVCLIAQISDPVQETSNRVNTFGTKTARLRREVAEISVWNLPIAIGVYVVEQFVKARMVRQRALDIVPPFLDPINENAVSPEAPDHRHSSIVCTAIRASPQGPIACVPHDGRLTALGRVMLAAAVA